MKWKVNQWWSTIPPLSTNRTITSENSLVCIYLCDYTVVFFVIILWRLYITVSFLLMFCCLVWSCLMLLGSLCITMVVISFPPVSITFIINLYSSIRMENDTVIIIVGFREDFVICLLETVYTNSEWLSRWSQSYICIRWTFHHTTLFRSALNSNEDVADYLISTIIICNGIIKIVCKLLVRMQH
jgi:hypothetical protein